ncbi:unnamed protein product, partial [Effrenium voratum]
LWARQEDLAGELQDLARSCEQQQHVGSVGERTLRLALKAQKAMNAAPHDAQLRQELGVLSEDLTQLWVRVEGNEMGLNGLTEALGQVCEEMSLLKGKRVASSVTQPKPRHETGAL